MSKKRRATKEKVGMKLSDWVESEQSANHSKKDQAERKDMGRRWRGGTGERHAVSDLQVSSEQEWSTKGHF